MRAKGAFAIAAIVGLSSVPKAWADSAVVTEPLWSDQRTHLFDGWTDHNVVLGKYGISLGAQETSEILANPTGGVHKGVVYDGMLLMSLGVDTGKAFGLEGGIFNISALQIHGRSISSNNLYVFQTASSIEAQRSTRLWELWYQQSFFKNRMDIKIGQQSLDQEFIVSRYDSMFVNGSLGWPIVPSMNMYQGGPGYPLSSLGLRVRFVPASNLVVLAGVFDDNPPGGSFGNDPQTYLAEQSGARFNLGTGLLFISEIQYLFNQQDVNSDTPHDVLPGIYRIGGYYDTGRFYDQRFGTDNLSLANPDSDGIPKSKRGNWSIYGVIDQMLWHFNDDDDVRAIDLFARLQVAPQTYNLVDLGFNAGFIIQNPLPHRSCDVFGVAYGMARLSPRARGLSLDYNAFSPTPQRSSENFLEVSYQFQVAGWWQLQPDFQYFFMPYGGGRNPYTPSRRISNEAVLGVRSIITF